MKYCIFECKSIEAINYLCVRVIRVRACVCVLSVTKVIVIAAAAQIMRAKSVTVNKRVLVVSH